MRRYETRSTMMTSNRPLEDWGKLIGDVPAATATLKALLGHNSLQTTARYLHVSTHRLVQTPSLLDLLVLPRPTVPAVGPAEGQP